MAGIYSRVSVNNYCFDFDSCIRMRTVVTKKKKDKENFTISRSPKIFANVKDIHNVSFTISFF